MTNNANSVFEVADSLAIQWNIVSQLPDKWEAREAGIKLSDSKTYIHIFYDSVKYNDKNTFQSEIIT